MRGYKPKGLFPTVHGSALPSRTGLFGTSLSVVSLSLIGDQDNQAFEFKASYSQNPRRMIEEGMPYDYRNDTDYRNKVSWATSGVKTGMNWNLMFLKRLIENRLTLLPQFLMDWETLGFSYGPTQAPLPVREEKVAYITPSYIIWDNDPSYTSFLGSPDRLELPKHVLRETGGHPETGSPTGRGVLPRFRTEWSF